MVYPAIAFHTKLDDNPSVSGQASEQEIDYRSLMRKFWFASIISIPVMFFNEWLTGNSFIVLLLLVCIGMHFFGHGGHGADTVKNKHGDHNHNRKEI